MSARTSQKYLLVEGAEDQRVIPYLMEKFIPWPDDKTQRPTEIEQFGGVEELLTAGVIEAKLKTSGLKALGIIVDADEDPMGRWDTIRTRCAEAFPMFPKHMPKEGLILQNSVGLRLGVWIMPDNVAQGMLETFLSYCVPKSGESLWEFAKKCSGESRKHGAEYKDSHKDKANIHTWLSWQDPPGLQIHTAVMAKKLQPTNQNVGSFVRWFKELFRV